MIDNVLLWLGLKKAVVIAGIIGGAISAGVMPGALAALNGMWQRMLCGAIAGGAIAGYGAEPLSRALDRPDYLQGVAIGLGLFGLSFVFKVLKTWNEFDIANKLDKLIDGFLGRIK